MRTSGGLFRFFDSKVTVTVPPGFDPRSTPVHQVDSHLPAVERLHLRPDALRARFGKPPDWEVEFSAEPKFSQRAPTAAAVLVPIIMHERPSVLLTQRSAFLSSHSGQVAFPGGKADAQDRDEVATALREAQEEIGLEAHFVQILGSLPAYTTGSAFVVTPVVALVEADAPMKANADEVDAIFEVPLDFLMDPANHRQHRVAWMGVDRIWLSMPYQDGPHERFIWGATAGMLRNLYRFLQA